MSFAQSTSDTLVVIHTNYGSIKVRLYEDTPLHRQNFIKLVQKGFYDSLLFHRVINGFMIQGGDPDSKQADITQVLGNGDIGYTLPAEINSNYFHKKGALAAARESDDVNPEKASSGCQFYIVQGKKFSQADMLIVENRMINQTKQNLLWKYLRRPENTQLRERYIAFQQTRNNDSLMAITQSVQPFIDEEMKTIKKHTFSETEKLSYATIGGAPHLDGNYTVFGEVVDGLDVIDKIAAVEVEGNNRPVKDVRMSMNFEIVNKK